MTGTGLQIILGKVRSPRVTLPKTIHRFGSFIRQRAATCWTQAVLVLRRLIERTGLDTPAPDSKISLATAYRYLQEAIDIIAANASDLKDVLARGRNAGWAHVSIDGTLIESTRSSAKSVSGHDLCYSGKPHAHGGNIQVVTDPTAFSVWTSPVEPGSTHDITAAREHALGLLHRAASDGLPTLEDKG